MANLQNCVETRMSKPGIRDNLPSYIIKDAEVLLTKIVTATKLFQQIVNNVEMDNMKERMLTEGAYGDLDDHKNCQQPVQTVGLCR